MLHDRGELVEGLPDVDDVFRGEGILDPDVYWEPAEGPGGETALVPCMPWGPDEAPSFRREDFAEVDSLTVEADEGS